MARILLIEDSPTERSVISSWAGAMGHEVLEAGTAEEGIEQAGSQNPDLILMDIVLPGKNGFEAIRSLRSQEATRGIPVIIISTKSQPTDIAWGKRQGAVDYLTKPFDKKALGDALRQAGLGG